jgi:hypothetical protein
MICQVFLLFSLKKFSYGTENNKNRNCFILFYFSGKQFMITANLRKTIYDYGKAAQTFEFSNSGSLPSNFYIVPHQTGPEPCL